MLKDIFVGGFGLTFMFNENVIEDAQLLILFLIIKEKYYLKEICHEETDISLVTMATGIPQLDNVYFLCS